VATIVRRPLFEPDLIRYLVFREAGRRRDNRGTGGRLGQW
jgi:hypothetical protein